MREVPQPGRCRATTARSHLVCQVEQGVRVWIVPKWIRPVLLDGPSRKDKGHLSKVAPLVLLPPARRGVIDDSDKPGLFVPPD